tara:strand:+ start:4452 stop:5042 length:591 start_codon:yes stop_codon:yes gene_type:complete
MTAFSEFYSTIEQADKMINDIKFNVDIMVYEEKPIEPQEPPQEAQEPQEPKEFYFDGLVMDNILSFIPKYEKKFRKFSEIKALPNYQGKVFYVDDMDIAFVKIEKITDCFVSYKIIRNKVVYRAGMEFEFLDDKFEGSNTQHQGTPYRTKIKYDYKHKQVQAIYAESSEYNRWRSIDFKVSDLKLTDDKRFIQNRN